MKRLFVVFLFASMLFFAALGQTYYQEQDKCGPYDLFLKSGNELPDDGWGYSYDSLLADIEIWEENKYIDVLSIGQSVENRELYELIITDKTVDASDKRRIYIHARTHPNEVQSFWVTNEIIAILLSDSLLGERLRETCIFHILPMYNPDGVELGYNRENANNIDIESNWNAALPEKEVQALQSRFAQLMQEPNPIEIALNMHSAYACTRYFVYHHANGTSAEFAQKEEYFISKIRSYFYEIQPYNYFMSWANSTPLQYPESWWWINYGETVMALTYEDMNCSSAEFYDKTAFAILSGIADIVDFGYNIDIVLSNKSLSSKIKTYPNPFSENVAIEWDSDDKCDYAKVTAFDGTVITELLDMRTIDKILWDGNDFSDKSVSPGMYTVLFLINNQVYSQIVVKQ